jgi:hypothetical protein
MKVQTSIGGRLARVCTAAVAALAGVAALAIPASADSPNNSAQGAITFFAPGPGADIHIAFSATSDATFQSTHGVSGDAGGMLNLQPDAHSLTNEPAVGRVGVSCLNVVNGNEAIMTGTVSEPISTNAFTGPPLNAPPNEWIVGASLVVIDNGGATPDQADWGYFVNPDSGHVITTTRCFGSGLIHQLLPLEHGHANVSSAAV